MEDTKDLVPEGYKLVLDKKLNCPLCQRPEFRGEWDVMIWSRKFASLTIKMQIEKELGLIFQPREIFLHSTHLKLIPIDPEAVEKENAELRNQLFTREKGLLEMSKDRKNIEYDFDDGLDGLIKALASEIDELKLQGFENDPSYTRKVEQYRRLLETKHKKDGTIQDENKVSVAVLEVRDLFRKMKEFEEEEKNGSNSNEGRNNQLEKEQM